MGDVNDVSALVRRLRRQAGLSQEELAHRSGLGLRTISYLESGRTRQPRGASLRLLAEALGVAPADLVAAGGGLVTIGCQLPADDPHFVGRLAEKARLADLAAPPGGALVGVAVTVVHGRPGVGKTSLAVHVAHAVRSRFPDGQLYVGLGGGAAPISPAEVLGRFLRALGSEVTPGSLTLDEQAAEFRAKLTDRRVLVVLDDAATEAQVRPLLPGTPGCAVLVTSRAPLAGLLGAGSVALEVLEPEDSLALLGRVVGADRVAAEGDAARRIAGACGGLPLALRIAAARSAAAPGTPMAELADVLDDEGSRLDGLTVGDVAVQSSFAVGYRSLDPVARRTYRLLGLLRAVDVPGWAVTALLDADRLSTDAAVAALVAARLLDRHGAGVWTHYRMHDLVRLDARARARAGAGAEDAEPERRAAVRRALSGWLHLAAEADRRLPSDTMPLPEPPPAGWQVDADTASVLLAEPLEWFEVERAALVDAVRQAVTEAPDLAAGLVDGLIDFCATRDYPDDWEAIAGLLAGWAESERRPATVRARTAAARRSAGLPARGCGCGRPAGPASHRRVHRGRRRGRRRGRSTPARLHPAGHRPAGRRPAGTRTGPGRARDRLAFRPGARRPRVRHGVAGIG